MNLKYFIVLVAGMAALAGCQEASEYIPSIYITEAQRQEVKTITISQAGEKAEFTVSAAQIVDRDTHVSFEACPERTDCRCTRRLYVCEKRSGDCCR